MKSSHNSATGAIPSGDAIDVLLAQWRRERPDVDLRPIGPLGRLRRCWSLVERRFEANFASFGVSGWEFDVLGTLRRSGPPYRLAPTTLFASLMVTSGTMTHRLRRLEAEGLVTRVPSPDDGRSLLVELSPAGLALVDRVLDAHTAKARAIVRDVPPEVLATLDAALSTLLDVLEQPRQPGD